ncbi:MAG TPA: sigma-70 family RNA polymerase sigma factor [Saprospiraceae bacterium]|nr:sigma-70 family RNA polymerase sigma factor [Saprospiraceae bacterium]
MKVTALNPEPQPEDFLSTDPQRRNRAFAALYRSPTVNGKIRDWAKLYNLRDKEPDDVLQEAIILLDEMLRSGRFRAESRVETFLLGICKNLMRDGMKKVNRIVLKESLPETALNSADELADHMVLSELTDAEQNRDKALREAMTKLTDKCQEALRLYYFEQKTMQQVAEARQLANAEQAKKAVFRCRESLKELIGNRMANY